MMGTSRKRSYLRVFTSLVLFGMAMGMFEAAIVVYLRELFYPEGFVLPLQMIPERLLLIEIVREAATIIMLVAVAVAVARRFWDGFGWFLIMFGIWDIFYYIWLRVWIGWPVTLYDWDILFLIPLPWLGPVIAPVLVAILMIVIGTVITILYRIGYLYRPNLMTWGLAIIATGAILYSFMRDTNALFQQSHPQPYQYILLFIGLLLYTVAFVVSLPGMRRDLLDVYDEK